jgi:hypothetical protein
MIQAAPAPARRCARTDSNLVYSYRFCVDQVDQSAGGDVAKISAGAAKLFFRFFSALRRLMRLETVGLPLCLDV